MWAVVDRNMEASDVNWYDHSDHFDHRPAGRLQRHRRRAVLWDRILRRRWPGLVIGYSADPHLDGTRSSFCTSIRPASAGRMIHRSFSAENFVLLQPGLHLRPSILGSFLTITWTVVRVEAMWRAWINLELSSFVGASKGGLELFDLRDGNALIGFASRDRERAPSFLGQAASGSSARAGWVRQRADRRKPRLPSRCCYAQHIPTRSGHHGRSQ